MSKEQAFLIALKEMGWLKRRRMVKNIGNGLGLSMLKDLSEKADSIWRWSNFYADKWEK